MQITVKKQNRFGNIDIVPIDETGKLLCALHGTKTFTYTAITICEKLGYIFNYIN